MAQVSGRTKTSARGLVILYLTLVPVAFYLLWGVAYTVKAGEHAELACDTTRNGGSMRTIYTGAEVGKGLDHVLCVLVSFFSAALSNPIFTPFLLEFLSLLAVFLSLVNITSYQSQDSAFLKYSPLLIGLLCQGLGAGIAVPIWCAAYCSSTANTSQTTPSETDSKQEADSIESINAIWSIFPSLFISYFVPAFLMLDPSHLLTADQIHIFLAIWQPFPLIFAFVHFILRSSVYLLPSFGPIPSPTTNTTKTAARNSLQTLSYLTTVIHFHSIYQIYLLFLSQPESQSIWVTLSTLLPTGGTIFQQTYSGASQIFLLFDFALVLFSLVVFVLFAPASSSGRRNLGGKERFWCGVEMVGLSIFRGTASAVIWVWERREEEVEERFREKED